jgi:membrane-bound inhibitor of C-type lysozyme/uncharacterized membrane protein
MLLVMAAFICCDEGEPEEPRTFVYECGEEYQFVARIQGESAWLFLPGETVELPCIESASGAKYSNGSVTFWSKGEEAILEIEGEARRSCKNNRAKAIWEHAKLNGVDFRATGNEPGWHLEISAGLESIVFVTDYGQSRFDFPYVEPVVDDEAATALYHVSSKGHEIEVRLEGGGCHDNMSGEAFETSVKVILDGRAHYGCGRALH